MVTVTLEKAHKEIEQKLGPQFREKLISMSAQQLVNLGLDGVALSEAIFIKYQALPETEQMRFLGGREVMRRTFLDEIVTATVWHGTRRREPIADLKRYGFCSYTYQQAVRWLDEAHRRLVGKTKAGPRTTKHLEKWKQSRLTGVKDPHRGQFSVTAIEEDACGESPHDVFTGKPDSASLLSGWADRNPEFVYDYLMMRATPQQLDQILTEMFGKPLKVKLRVRMRVRQLMNPQDIHIPQRCFKPSEILEITPCPPKTAKQLKAEIDSMWAPAVVPFTGR